MNRPDSTELIERLEALRALPDLAERLLFIEELRMSASDFLSDEWGLLTGISDLATGAKTPAEVSDDLDEYL